MDRRHNVNRILCIIIISLTVATVSAGLNSDSGPYSFAWVWDEEASAVNGTVGQQQLSFTVSEAAGGISFRFTNIGDESCSLTGIYFESSLGTLTELISIDDSCEGVAFEQKSRPRNMPRWRKVDFEPAPDMAFHSASQSDGQNGTSHNGIEPGEWLGITLATQADIDQIFRELDSQDIRIGIHVQAFSDGGSESFVNIPDPATITILGFGALMLRRKKQKRP